MAETLNEILRSPRDAAFSRIRYVARYADPEQMSGFLRGLYLKAVEAKDTGGSVVGLDIVLGREIGGQHEKLHLPETKEEEIGKWCEEERGEDRRRRRDQGVIRPLAFHRQRRLASM